MAQEPEERQEKGLVRCCYWLIEEPFLLFRCPVRFELWGGLDRPEAKVPSACMLSFLYFLCPFSPVFRHYVYSALLRISFYASFARRTPLEIVPCLAWINTLSCLDLSSPASLLCPS